MAKDDITLGISPTILKRLTGVGPPLAVEVHDAQTDMLRAIGVERVLVSAPAWRDPSFNPNTNAVTINPPVLNGRYYGFRIEPYSVLGAPLFQLPRTIITKGLSRQEGGDGQTKVWPIASKSWFPHAFSSLAFGLEAAGANATDGPWEVWGAETPDAMLINLGELLSTGYVRDPITGLWTTPPIMNPQPILYSGFATAKPVNLLNVTGANGFTLGPTTIASPFDKIFGFFDFSTAGAVSSGIEIDVTVNGQLFKVFGPGITAAVTKVTYFLTWGYDPGSYPGLSAGVDAGSAATIALPGTPTNPFTITLNSAGITAASVDAQLFKTY